MKKIKIIQVIVCVLCLMISIYTLFNYNVTTITNLEEFYSQYILTTPWLPLLLSGIMVLLVVISLLIKEENSKQNLVIKCCQFGLSILQVFMCMKIMYNWGIGLDERYTLEVFLSNGVMVYTIVILVASTLLLLLSLLRLNSILKIYKV